MKKVLLDANKIINIIKKEAESIQWLNEQYNIYKNIMFFTTPLIRHEVLRFYPEDEKDEYERAKQFLSELSIIDIDNEISNIATDIIRYEKTHYPERYIQQSDGTQKRIDKYNFDNMYVSTAKCHNLSISSSDKDIEKISILYEEMIKK